MVTKLDEPEDEADDDEPVDDEPLPVAPVDDEPVPVAPADEVPLPDAPDPLAEEPDDELEPPPLTVCPSWSFTVTTVPLIGAVRVVSATVFWSEVTVCLSWRTWLSSARTVEETGASAVSVAAIPCSCAVI